MEPEPVGRAILLTPPASAAIAVVRLLGPAVGAFLSAHFSKAAVPGRCVHGDLHDAGRIIDDPVVVISEDGSFADLNLHGGPWVVRATLDLARRAGFAGEEPSLPIRERAGVRVETSGSCEVDLDAVDGPTYLDREMAAHVPLAKTELALRVLLAQPAAWRRFCDGAQAADDLPTRIQSILDDRALHWLLHPPRVAIVGAPNVGKSTLANQLFAQERSITADLPGTTRDWVGEIANIDGLAVQLIDTPGQRDTADPIEHASIQRSREQIDQADLVLLILDPTQPFAPQQMLLTEHPRALLILNKIDRGTLPIPGALLTIATTGQGLDAVRTAILRHFWCHRIDPTHPRFWTARQRSILARAIAKPDVLRELW